MGNQLYQYSVYGNKRRRLEPIGQQMISTITPTSNDTESDSVGFFGFITKFFAPMTNLFRPSIKSRTEKTCILSSESFPKSLNKQRRNGATQRINGTRTADEDEDTVVIEQEKSMPYSSISEKGRSIAEKMEDKENDKKISVGENRKSSNIPIAVPSWAYNKDDFRKSIVNDDSLNFGSPSPQPERNISRQVSPSYSHTDSTTLSDKWERRRTLSSAKNALLLSRYSPYKIFSSENLAASKEKDFGRKTNVVDKEGKERYRKFLEEAGILKTSTAFPYHNERRRLSKKTNYLELLQRGQSALNSVSQSASSSANLSRQGSISTISSDNIPVAVNSNNDVECGVNSNCNIRERKDSENGEEVCVIWDAKYHDNFKALWEKEKNTKLLAEHRLAMHRQQAILRDRRAKELQIQKRLIEEARRDEELSLEEQLRKKLTLTGYIFRPRKVKDEFPELDDEAMLVVENAWDRKLPLSEKLSNEITRKDLLTLKGVDWLNDEVINFYMNLICERSKTDKNLPKVYAFSSFFYPALSNKGYTSVKRWTRKIDIFAYELLLVPVHLGAHWCLAVIDFENRIIDYYDSMGGSNDHCLDILSEYLCDESLDKKKKEFDLSEWHLVNRDDIPQQMNGSDCGMFACKFAEYAARRAEISFNQEHMPYFRERMVYEICQKKLL